MVDELSWKVGFYVFVHENNIDLTPKHASGSMQTKAQKKKWKEHKEKKEAVALDRAEVPPLVDRAVPAEIAHEKFYITTAINYTNGNPHLGHMYEAITTDAIARYHRNYGRDVFFLTGTDEHGQKIQQTAQANGMTPLESCNMYAKRFQDLNKRLLISNDNFIRTTQPHHEEISRRLWERVRSVGDIYLSNYVGWYNVYEEQYVTDLEAEQSGYKDEHGRPLEKKGEEAYFFRMSRYQDALLKHIKENPHFIQPEERKAEILSFLSKPLQDLCVSRTVCDWGVVCPTDPEYKGDKHHVMYVWFDALTNYLSGIGYLSKPEDGVPDNSRYWPCDVHIIGKDIIRFHCVYWPTMLMSAGVPLPKSVFGHGFVQDKDGRKMSKSLGNVIDPNWLVDMYPIDAIRYYICRESPYGSDLPFSETSLALLYNAVMQKGIGNLVHRATSICEKYCQGKIPSEAAYKLDSKLPFDLGALISEFESSVCIAGAFQLQKAAAALAVAIDDTNKYMQDAAPWKMKSGEESVERDQRAITRAVLEASYMLAHFIEPFSPNIAAGIFHRIGVKQTKICLLSKNFDNLPPGTQTYVGPILVEELLTAEQREKEKQEASKQKDQNGMPNGGGDKAKKRSKKPSGNAKADDAPQAEFDFDYLDIRVGKIVKVWNHEKAEKLYCEQIDVGEESGPREIASGLRPFYSLDEMQDHRVLVVCNLKPAKLVGFTSHGMVLCASTEDKVEFIEPPTQAKLGQRVYLQGQDVSKLPDPAPPNFIAKKKIFPTVAENLKTNENCEATWSGKLLVTPEGPCKARTLTDVSIR